MGWKRALIASLFKVPAIRDSAVRELVATLRVIADSGALLDQDPSGDELLRRNPLLKKAFGRIEDELAAERLVEIKNGFSALQPFAAQGFEKARFGSANDGGYVMLEDFGGIDTALSLGIAKDVSWDLAIADKAITVYQFDHSITTPPVIDDNRLVFARKRISTEVGPDNETLSSLVKKHDKHRNHPNLLLKIDIEADEWAIFDETPLNIISRFSQIVGEFHFFEGFSSDIRCRRLMKRVLDKLKVSYEIIHVHANNYGDFHKVGNLAFPNALELTFANRALYSFHEAEESFPGPLDAPNDPHRPDAHLESLWSETASGS